MADLAAMLQDSLSRTGKGGMLVAFLNADGTVSAPGISFLNEPNSGLYRVGAFDHRYAVNGVWQLHLNTTQVETRNDLVVGNDADIRGDANVDGTLEVTGVATFAATPVFSAGLSGILRTNLPAVDEEVGARGVFTGSSLVVNDLSAEITLPATTGRPVIVSVQPGDAVGPNAIYLEADGAGDRYADVYIARSVDGGAFSEIAAYTVYALAGSNGAFAAKPLNIGSFIDTPGAGSIKYKLRYKVDAAGGTVTNAGMVVVAYEM
jgi:hypothetical protein